MNVLLDSDYLFGLFVPDDIHHKSSTRIIKASEKNRAHFYALNLVLQETATVVSNKRTQEDAINFYQEL